MKKRNSYISEILILHGKKYTHYEFVLQKSSRTAWKYKTSLGKVRQLLVAQQALSEVCEMPISCHQLLVDPTVVWEQKTWTYENSLKRFCNQNGITIQFLATMLNIEYGTLREHFRKPLIMDCETLVCLADLLNLSVDNFLTSELKWSFGGPAPKKNRYKKVLAARSQVINVDEMLSSW